MKIELKRLLFQNSNVLSDSLIDRKVISSKLKNKIMFMKINGIRQRFFIYSGSYFKHNSINFP